ncbi:MAG: hypothetical protein ACFFCZ_20170 [Promethearchaeota archaeon]
MGCSTDLNVVKKYLESINADQKDGRFLISGNPPILFMGIGPDCILDDETYCFINGEKKNLVDLLVRKRKGIMVHVIG